VQLVIGEERCIPSAVNDVAGLGQRAMHVLTDRQTYFLIAVVT
jgi:hypothetical protein